MRFRHHFAIASVLFAVGCLSRIAVPPPQLPPAYHQENFSVVGPDNGGLAGAHASVISDDGGTAYADSDADGRISLGIPNQLHGGGTLTVTKDGYLPYEGRLVFCLQTCEQPAITLSPSIQPLPTPPSRDDVLNMHLTFQGLYVSTNYTGANFPWFEPWIAELPDAADRAAVYAAKHASPAWDGGDTHIILAAPSWGPLYPGNPPQPASGGYALCKWVAQPCEQPFVQPAAFRALVEEVIRAGFHPMIFLAGDDGENGYPIATAQLPLIINALKGGYDVSVDTGLRVLDVDLNSYVVYSPGWDGVFYGYKPQHIYDFGHWFRSLLPNGYLAIEHQPGRIPAGEGPQEWNPAADRMHTYDLILSEFGQPGWAPNDDTVWQIGGRLLGPRYVRGPEQPAGDDPNPPYYLRTGNARGPYYACAFEWVGEYLFVRRAQSKDDNDRQRAYYKARGWSCGG